MLSVIPYTPRKIYQLLISEKSFQFFMSFYDVFCTIQGCKMKQTKKKYTLMNIYTFLYFTLIITHIPLPLLGRLHLLPRLYFLTVDHPNGTGGVGHDSVGGYEVHELSNESVPVGVNQLALVLAPPVEGAVVDVSVR